MLAMFLASLDQTIVATAMPRIVADLEGFDRYTWVTTAYLVASTTLVPIVGRLTDMYGRKRFYVADIVIFLVGSVLSGLSQSMTQLIIFRGVQGVGGGIMMARSFIAIGDLFSPAERGKYQGVVGAMFGVSSVIGPALGGVVTDSLSWHWILYINIPLGIPILALFIAFFPDIRPLAQRHHIDYWGVTTLILTVVPLMLALSWGGVQYEWSSPRVIGFLAFSASMGTLFVVSESRVAEPIIPLGLFRNPVVTVSLITIFLTGFAMFGGIIFIPLFFQAVLGASATSSGSFLTPMMLGVVAGSIMSGQALARLGGHYRLQGLIGLTVMAAGLFLISRMSIDTGFGLAVTNIVIMGFGLGITLPVYTLAVQNAVPHRLLGVATSSTQFFRSIGGTLGLAVLGSVMTNRFASRFTSGVNPDVREFLPEARFDALSRNPQALISPDAEAQLETAFESAGPEGTGLFQGLLDTLHISLSTAITDVFLIALVIIGIAWIATVFLREIPLRRDSKAPGTPGPAERAQPEATRDN